MALTEKGRRHEEKMKQMELDAKAAEADATRNAQLESDRMHFANEEAKRQDAIAERRSKERIAAEQASIEKEKNRLIAEGEADDRQKHHEFNMAKIAAEQSMSETEEKEQTRRVEISVKRDVEISNNERLVKEKEYEYKTTACKEVSSMFSSYLSAVTESHKQEIEMLIHINTTRKEKYLKSLESARAKQTELLELSKQASGQEKAIYLNELSDVENSIRNLQEEDKEADESLTAKLMDLKEVQKIEMAAQQEKMISTNSIFLDFNGDEQ